MFSLYQGQIISLTREIICPCLYIYSFQVSRISISCAYQLTEIQSAFAIYGFYPDEPESGVMTMSEDAVITNIGDDFDPETGRYTAPVDGTYIFDLNLYKLGNSLPFVRCYLRKNGEKVAVAFIPDNVLSEHEGSATTVLQLMENDVVDVGDCNDVGKIDSYTSFSGYLHRTD